MKLAIVRPGEKKTTSCAFSIRPGATETFTRSFVPLAGSACFLPPVFVRTAALRGFARFCGNWLRPILAQGPYETPLEQIGESLAGLVVLADDKQFSRLQEPSNTYPSGGYDEYQAQVCV
jgi:hypothetical protein